MRKRRRPRSQLVRAVNLTPIIRDCPECRKRHHADYHNFRTIDQVSRDLPVPITGAISDGHESIRNAVAHALRGVPHQLCHFQYLREAAKPIYEADRRAKEELKNRVCRIRPIGRAEEEA